MKITLEDIKTHKKTRRNKTLKPAERRSRLTDLKTLNRLEDERQCAVNSQQNFSVLI